MPLPTTPFEIAEQVSARCSRSAVLLAKRGQSIQFWLQLLRIGSTVIGIIAMVFTLSPLTASIFPQANIFFALISSVTLVVASTLYMVIGTNPPERYMDYARYIEGYARRLQEIAANDSMDQATKKLQLLEIVRLANLNLQDVTSRWPWASGETNA